MHCKVEETVFPEALLDTVYEGSCLEAMKALPDNCVGLTVTSPPYYNWKDYAQWPDYPSYLEAVSQWFRELYRITRPGRRIVWNVCVLAHPDGYHKGLLPLPHDSVTTAIKEGWLFSQEIIWDDPAGKDRWPVGSFPLGPAVLMRRSVEHLLVFRKPKPDGSQEYEKLPPELKPYNLMSKDFFRDRVAKQVWVIPPRNGRDGHPAAYPEELVEPCIRMWSRPGDVVFDPFAGTGTTALSALQWKRHFYGAEWTPQYYKLCQKNIEMRRLQLLNEEIAMSLFPEAHSKDTYEDQLEMKIGGDYEAA